MTYLCPCKNHCHHTSESHARFIRGASNGGCIGGHISGGVHEMSPEARERMRDGGRRGGGAHEMSPEAKERYLEGTHRGGRKGGPRGGATSRGRPRPDLRGKSQLSQHRTNRGIAMHMSHRAAMQRASISSPSMLQLRVAYRLFGEFPNVIIEAPFGPYRVDIYLPPPYHLGFEVDGTYWHKNRDSCRRDRYLLETFGLFIVHLDEVELNVVLREEVSPWLGSR